MESVQKLDHYSCTISNKVGEGARVLNAFREAGVNFTAIWGYAKNTRAGILEMLPEDGKALVKAGKKLGLEVKPVLTAFYYSGVDHPGAVAEALSALAGVGINVAAAQAVCGGEGRFGAAVFVAKADGRKAAKALGVK